MFDDTLELAEFKLLVLYIINQVNVPISKSKITEIILENNFINYFTLVQYIEELLSSSLLKYKEDDDKSRLYITDRGKKVLSFFQNRIRPEKMLQINNYLNGKISKIKEEIMINGDYALDGESYLVDLKANENDSLLMDLKLNVASKKQALDLIKLWKENSSDIYNKIIQILINE
jgi:predicted transcriptional regulator